MTAALRPSLALRFSAATGLGLGARERQEDALVCDVPAGGGIGFAVLADGMGGHAAGDIASKIVVTEVFSELKMRSGDAARLESGLPKALTGAALAANRCLARFVAHRPGARGMGATLLAPVLIEDRLHWISIGDSLLYLFRDGALRQLNTLHTSEKHAPDLAPAGVLTSALVGGEIAKIDCPALPMRLAAGDVVLAASDGILSLGDTRLAELLRQVRTRSADAICSAILRAIDALDDPAQDNVALCVIKVEPSACPAEDAPAPPRAARMRPVQKTGTTTIVASVTRTAGPER